MFKKLSFALLALFVLGGSTLAFAWWDTNAETETITIGVGQGVTLTVVELSETQGALVPSGVIEQANQVTEYELTYDVNLDATATTTLNLSVSESNVQLAGLAEVEGQSVSNFLTITDDAPATIAPEDTVTVTVTVTLDLDQTTATEIVDAFKNGSITFDLTFEVTE